MVEHPLCKRLVGGSIPLSGSELINKNNNFMARENIAKMKCEVCKTVNYFTTRNKKKLKEKLSAKKHCKKCKKHTLHKETK
jgi:large subunit ribosomal protein L33